MGWKIRNLFVSYFLCIIMVLGMVRPACASEIAHTDRQVIVYYPNWYLEEKSADEGGEVGSIPWDSVTIINHAFFTPYPDGDSTESSFERKKKNLPARTEFKCVSTRPEEDFEDQTRSQFNDLPRNHFVQYEKYAKDYPDVKIMISVGGATNSGFFSEMCHTSEGRESFTASLVELMQEYPFISGIDLDWEFPAGSMDGERQSEGEGDEGCPIWESASDDNRNFSLLLAEMREAFDEKFGEGDKLITACASGSIDWVLPCQQWEDFAQHLNYINIMSYDLAGTWDGVTGHHSPENKTEDVINYFLTKGIAPQMLCIGSPMYPIWFKMKGKKIPDAVVGARIVAGAKLPGALGDISATQQLESECVTGYTYAMDDGYAAMGERFDHSSNGSRTGWNADFDEEAGAAYLYNNNPKSKYYKWFASYENPLSLQRKLNLILSYDLAGIIVWESTLDTKEHLMLNHMAAGLATDKYTTVLAYDANGGEGAPPEQFERVTYPDTEATFSISPIIPTRWGYSFEGWYTGKEDGMRVEDTISVGENEKKENQAATIYAHWSRIEPTIIYAAVNQKIPLTQEDFHTEEPIAKFVPSKKRNITISSGGVLKAKRSGDVEVIAYRRNGKKYEPIGASCIVKVIKPRLSKATLVECGQRLNPDVLLQNDEYKPTKWTSSNERIVSVDRETGELVALKSGRVKLTAYFGSGKMAARYRTTITVKLSSL